MLQNNVESFWSTQSCQEATEIFCTYCIHSPVPAVKACLLCEAFLCEDHLRVHSKSTEHVLSDPTTSVESRKCSIHRKILEYYCTQDAACICVSCCLVGEHKEHHIQSLEEASEKKKNGMKAFLQKQITKGEEIEKSIKGLQESWITLQEKATNVTGRVNAMFGDIRKQLEDLEKNVLNEISRQVEQASLYISNWIKKLEVKKDKLSTQVLHVEKLWNMTDPLTFLQEPDSGHLCDTEEEGNEDRERHDELLTGEFDVDVAGISRSLHTGLSGILTQVNRGVSIPGPADIILDLNTAGHRLHVSDDRKTVTCLDGDQNYPETTGRFQWAPQVLSSQSFSSGKHYWEVDLRGSDCWRVGTCYPSIDRGGVQGESVIGDNNKSWCLKRSINQCLAVYDGKEVYLPANVPVTKVRISLDYETGQISFYEVGIPIQHLHTFTTTFTEPLHAALCVWGGSIRLEKPHN